MKKIFLSLILITVSTVIFGQYWTDIHNNQKIDRVWGTKVLNTPSDTVSNKLPGSIAYLNGTLYVKSTLSWDAVQSTAVNVLNTFTDLLASSSDPFAAHPELYHVKGFYTANDGSGGDFVIIDTMGASLVPGMVYPVGTTRAYVRIVSNASAFNLKWFGAIGGGLATFHQDSLALRNAMVFLNTITGSKRLYVPDAQYADGSRSFYGISGTGFMDLNNIEIFGDGKGKSEIRNVSPLDAATVAGSIFIGSNYETDSTKSPFHAGVKKYSIDTAGVGEVVLKLREAWIGLGHDLYIGEIIAYGWNKTYKGDTKGKPIFSFMENNRVIALTDTTVTLEYPTSFALKMDTAGNYPTLFNLNDKNNFVRNGKPFYTTNNFSLHDMTITQAQVDELADTTISARLAGVWQPGGFFESNFYNLDIDAYSGLGGNLWTRCLWQNIHINSEKKLMDFGFGSGPGNVMKDIVYEFRESPASDYASGWFISNNGNHGFSATNITATGNFRGSNFFTLTGVRDAELRNININFPNYNYDQSVFVIGNSDSFNVNTNLTLDNINVTFGSIGKGMQILNPDLGSSISNVNISNIYLNGNMLYYTGATLYQFNSSGVYLNPKRQDQYSTNGSTYQCSSSTMTSVGESVTKWFRVSGTNDPLPTGVLTKINGNGDGVLNYTATSIAAVSTPDALSISDIKGGLSIRNFNAARGRLYLDSVLNSTLIDIKTGDSLFANVTGNTFTGSRFRVNVPATNYYNLPGGEINVIGGVSYLNGLALGAPLPKGTNLTYTGSIAWDGTAPLTPTTSYSWSEDNNGKIDLWMQFSYATAGVSNTTMTLDWPTGVPLPLDPTASGAIEYAEACKIVTGGSVTNQTASFAHIKKVSPGVYNIIVATGAVAAKVVYFHLTFPKQ
jgi:hypothetical protein